MNGDDTLRAQDWARLTAQLTALAHKRSKRRSWEAAQDHAKTAIAHAFSLDSSREPRKAPVIRCLAEEIITLSKSDWRRRRNPYEVALDAEAEDFIAGTGEPSDGGVDLRRHAVSFHERLTARLADDVVATMVVKLMTAGISAPRDLAQASGRSLPEIQDARRRIRYQKGQLTKLLSGTIEEDEVSQ